MSQKKKNRTIKKFYALFLYEAIKDNYAAPLNSGAIALGGVITAIAKYCKLRRAVVVKVLNVQDD